MMVGVLFSLVFPTGIRPEDIDRSLEFVYCCQICSLRQITEFELVQQPSPSGANHQLSKFFKL